jgi:H+/Cl- antiporter ClcA
VLPPTIGGVVIGAVNWVLPATVGNGHLTTPWVLKYGPTGDITQKLLISCAFARAFLLAISMNCGFIGGFVFPMLSMGAIAGTVANLQYPELPLGLTVGCFMFALPCGIVPLPFTFTALGCFLFFFGLYETVPIFVSILVSYLLVCGTGIFQRLRSGKKQEGGDDAKPSAAASASERHAKAEKQERQRDREEEEEYVVNQYATRAARVKGDHSLESPLV